MTEEEEEEEEEEEKIAVVDAKCRARRSQGAERNRSMVATA